MHIYILDLLGTFAFAVFGTHVALNKKFDLFGILACSILTAVGGGTIREVLLNKMPFYFFDDTYMIVILAGAAFTIFTYYIFERIERAMMVVDAVGLSAFALIGATAAGEAKLGLVATVLLATITAVGGGILRDISVREVPAIFHTGLYATPAALLGLLFGIFPQFRQDDWFLALILLLAFALRLTSIFGGLNLWRPYNINVPLQSKSKVSS